MKARQWILRSALVTTLVLLASGVSARAQGRPGGGGPPGGGGGMGPGGGGMGPGGFPGGDRPGAGPPPGGSSPQGEGASTMRGGLQLGPPGRWWDDKHFSKQLGLRPEQQRNMDAVFETNRALLQTRYQTLQQEEGKMAVLTKAAVPNEDQLFSQIDRLAQARADLEKTTTHYLLQIRREMDPAQIARLDEHR